MRRPRAGRDARVERKRRIATAACAALAAMALVEATRARADSGKPSPDSILAQMKAALEPEQTSLRRMQMTVHQEAFERQFTLVQARKHIAGEGRSLTVILEPEDAKGLAYLVSDHKPGQHDNREWIYVPVVRRVRELVPAENYTSFLDSDFTYADLGFIDLDTTNKLLATETIGGRKAYEIESIPSAKTKQWYYARIVTWVDTETLLPVKREFYSPSGIAFKVETFDSVSRVSGVPTPFHVTMKNVPAGTWTELQVTDVAYGIDLPDQAFTKDKLRTIADLAFWKERHPAPSPAGS
ncbi:MAG TPA: outer membrane lipoprotein-sorting protein [Candidatus Binatia bacterium]|nr:outer membrane lipoprotein-sorting protein [Candidatus Binatia bacterium]